METKARVTFQQSLGSQMATSPPTEQQVPAAPPRGDSWFTKFLLAVGFSFVSGWIDAVSLIRFRAFGTMMVGNVLYWGIHLVYGQIAHPDVVGHALVVHSETVRSSIVSTQFYGIVVLCYLAGIMLHTALNKYTRLTARTYAPIIVACTVLFEVMVKAHVGHMPHEAYYLCFLAPVFGFMNSLIFVGRVGRLPWATTADMQTLGSTLVLMLASVGRQWHLGVRGVRGVLRRRRRGELHGGLGGGQLGGDQLGGDRLGGGRLGDLGLLGERLLGLLRHPGGLALVLGVKGSLLGPVLRLVGGGLVGLRAGLGGQHLGGGLGLLQLRLGRLRGHLGRLLVVLVSHLVVVNALRLVLRGDLRVELGLGQVGVVVVRVLLGSLLRLLRGLLHLLRGLLRGGGEHGRGLLLGHGRLRAEVVLVHGGLVVVQVALGGLLLGGRGAHADGLLDHLGLLGQERVVVAHPGRRLLGRLLPLGALLLGALALLLGALGALVVALHGLVARLLPSQRYGVVALILVLDVRLHVRVGVIVDVVKLHSLQMAARLLDQGDILVRSRGDADGRAAANQEQREEREDARHVFCRALGASTLQ
mmetsp:Transcript_39046/g.103184  ORF Transcript_39046/g.103184 Transcript_39046/m.103184 type:complete len:587 (-) Transcript_39046:40-1800(-)